MYVRMLWAHGSVRISRPFSLVLPSFLPPFWVRSYARQGSYSPTSVLPPFKHPQAEEAEAVLSSLSDEEQASWRVAMARIALKMTRDPAFAPEEELKVRRFCCVSHFASVTLDTPRPRRGFHATNFPLTTGAAGGGAGGRERGGACGGGAECGHGPGAGAGQPRRVSTRGE